MRPAWCAREHRFAGTWRTDDSERSPVRDAEAQISNDFQGSEPYSEMLDFERISAKRRVAFT